MRTDKFAKPMRNISSALRTTGRSVTLDLIVLSESVGAFMNISGKFKRLEGFSKLEFDAGSKSYERKYLSNSKQSVDIVSCTAKISYIFDRMRQNQVHDELVSISDFGKTGRQCIKDIVLVDFSKEKDGGFEAVLQSFAVKCDDRRPENGFLDYSGFLIATGEKSFGYAVLSQDKKSITFAEKRRGILCDLNS